MKTASICVYRDTIEQHDADWNLTEIVVTEEFARKYFEERIKGCGCEWKSFEEFIADFTADDTRDFYAYAKEHDAILSMEHWR